MGDEKSSSIVMASRDREPRDRELLIPVADSANEDISSKPSSSSSSSHHLTGREVVFRLLLIGLGLFDYFLFCFVLLKFVAVDCEFELVGFC